MKIQLRFILLIIALAVLFSAFIDKPRKPRTAGVVFYNVENLFDTLDNTSKNDNEFLPTGEKNWNTERYNTKLERIAEVLKGISEELPAVVGFAEVENRNVLEDLALEEILAPAKYKVIHFESPDRRGIDVGLFYSKKKFKIFNAKRVPVPTGLKNSFTRDILLVHGRLKRGPEIYFIVNHWPSRYGGQEKSEPKRISASRILAQKIDSLLLLNPEAHIIAMGDFNDYPDNKSISEVLLHDRSTNLTNLMDRTKSQYPGSYHYRGKWGYLDQFIVTTSLVDSALPDIHPNTTMSFSTPKMIYTKRNGKNIPNRTYGGSKYYGGYSDHLPIYTELVY